MSNPSFFGVVPIEGLHVRRTVIKGTLILLPPAAQPVGQHQVPEHGKDHAGHRIEYREMIWASIMAIALNIIETARSPVTSKSTTQLLRPLLGTLFYKELFSGDTKSTNWRRTYLSPWKNALYAT